jgi:hypothetical protein
MSVHFQKTEEKAPFPPTYSAECNEMFVSAPPHYFFADWPVENVPAYSSPLRKRCSRGFWELSSLLISCSVLAAGTKARDLTGMPLDSDENSFQILEGEPALADAPGIIGARIRVLGARRPDGKDRWRHHHSCFLFSCSGSFSRFACSRVCLASRQRRHAGWRGMSPGEPGIPDHSRGVVPGQSRLAPKNFPFGGETACCSWLLLRESRFPGLRGSIL